MDAAQVVTLASNSVEYAMKSAQVPVTIQETINEEHSQPVLLPEASSRHAPVLQFVSSHMVSSFFPSYIVLIYSLVCVPTIGLIA